MKTKHLDLKWQPNPNTVVVWNTTNLYAIEIYKLYLNLVQYSVVYCCVLPNQNNIITKILFYIKVNYNFKFFLNILAI